MKIQSDKILPGTTLGMLGGGQLGRMFTIAARTMGYEVVVLDPDKESPAGKLATTHICADYSDQVALDQIAKNCDAITTEFENVPAATLDALAKTKPVRPGAKAISIAQDRIQEKNFLKDNGFTTAPFAVIHSLEDLKNSISEIGTPSILKVSRFGYDGKGQFGINTESDIEKAWQALEGEACVLEQRMPLDIEVSVVLARGTQGEVATYPVSENIHEGGILDVSVVPARIDKALEEQVIDMAKEITTALDYIGLMAVEFFISNGKILVNEIAPRPHNSGHYTLDACLTDQFEQQVRAVCGLPLGDTTLLSPVVMINMLGDIWHGGQTPKWQKLLDHPNVKLHLYGKREARPGRKMGHFNVLSKNIDDALQLAQDLKQQLSKAE
ncbi:MAG TPA: 5-(carboxyamino)imidazole ribonucleotide synthase [Gammaproteobacteria bacterium]|nr:5-(carboxyamino)imidazole ribonucleotide synthase [Gammaproteobacteria bacterium]